MDDLIVDVRRFADELRKLNPSPDSVEEGLIGSLQRFFRTLEEEGRPQRGSMDALGRYCVEHMDWSSPLFERCMEIVERARAYL